VPSIISVEAAAAQSAGFTLYAVSGENGDNPQSLWTVDPVTAVPTLVLTFEAVDPGVTDGEALAALGTSLYRLSGRGTGQVLNDVTVPGHVVGSTTPSGDAYEEAGGLTADGTDLLMAESFNATQRGLYSITTAGVATRIGDIDHRSKGLAFDLAGTTLYGVANENPARLVTIDPATGATLTTVTMTDGATIVGANGLATHPGTGELWVLVSFAAAGPRSLGTVDPVTGVVSVVGDVDDGNGQLMAGIAWI
jgi:hypothetical protein